MTPEESKKPNGLKKTIAIIGLVSSLLVLGGTMVGSGIKIGRQTERIDNLENAIVDVKADQVEILRRLRNTETNTYAIAVKLEIENIIKPVDK